MSEITQDYYNRLGRPIVALATAPGGPVSILRISGNNLQELKVLFDGFPKNKNEFIYTTIKDNEKIIDKGLLLNFINPHSFTGEDVLEFQGHGISSITDSIINLLKSKFNVLEALPGEFSFRAYMNGKASLEEVSKLNQLLNTDVLENSSKILHVSKSNSQILNSKFEVLNKSIQQARARVEAAIDFSEYENDQKEEIEGSLFFVKEALNKANLFLNIYDNVFTNSLVPRVVLKGQPNVGKSTLFNILCSQDRVIVNSKPGTTTDFIEISLKTLNGFSFKLIDTAGIRENNVDSEIEKIGIQKTQKILESADIVLHIDKADNYINDNNPFSIFSHKDQFDINAQNAFDFKAEANDLRLHVFKVIEDKIKDNLKNIEFNPADLCSKRQYVLLKDICKNLSSLQASITTQLPLEIVGNSLREIDEKTQKLYGKNLGEDYLQEVFSMFCVGK